MPRSIAANDTPAYLAAAKSQYYIASIAGYDIARTDFDTELEVAKKRYAKIYGDQIFASARGNALIDKLKTQIVSRLIAEGVIMQEITKSDFRVDTATVERELQKFFKEKSINADGFKRSLNETGYDFEYFKKNQSKLQQHHLSLKLSIIACLKSIFGLY